MHGVDHGIIQSNRMHRLCPGVRGNPLIGAMEMSVCGKEREIQGKLRAGTSREAKRGKSLSQWRMTDLEGGDLEGEVEGCDDNDGSVGPPVPLCRLPSVVSWSSKAPCEEANLHTIRLDPSKLIFHFMQSSERNRILFQWWKKNCAYASHGTTRRLPRS